jgi:hypothetical protein
MVRPGSSFRFWRRTPPPPVETDRIKELNSMAPFAFNIRPEEMETMRPVWRMQDVFSLMRFDVSDPIQATLRSQMASIVSGFAHSHIEETPNCFNGSHGTPVRRSSAFQASARLTLRL